jgi:hypothetical protein
MRKTPHTHYSRGKRLFLIMRNGETFVDRFVERRGRVMVLEDAGRVEVAAIRAVSFYRPRQ